MSSFLDVEGAYDQTRRYIVSNWSDQDFTQKFGEESAYNNSTLIITTPAHEVTIKSGDMLELDQFHALTFARHFVDREMQKVAEKLEGKAREKIEISIGNKYARKPYEDKTVKEIVSGEENPIMAKMREEIRQEELAKIKAETSKTAEKTDKVEEKIDKRTKEYKEKTAEFQE